MYLKSVQLLIFLTAGKIQTIFPFLAKYFILQIATVIPLLGIMSNNILQNNVWKCFSSRQGKILSFFIFWMVMSVPFGVYPGLSFKFLTENFWKTILIFIILISYGSSEEGMQKIISTYIYAMGISCIYSVLFSSGDRLSIEGSGYDPNDTALIYLIALPFASWKFLSSYKYEKIIHGMISLFLLIGIVQTKSRGGFIGLIAVSIIMLGQCKQLNMLNIKKIILFVIAIVFVIIFSGGKEYIDRMSTLLTPSNDYNITSDTGRIKIWKDGLDMMIKNPLTGVGVQCFITADGMLYRDEGGKWSAAHNSFIQVGAELGIPGLLAFCYLIFHSASTMKRIAKNNINVNQYRAVTGLSIYTALIAYIVSGSFLSAAYVTPFYLLLGLSFSFEISEKCS